MSDYGSYCTDCIWCPDCARSVLKVLVNWLNPGPVVAWVNSKGNPCVLAGQVSDVEPTATSQKIEQLRDEIEKKICHEVRFVQLLEDNAVPEILVFRPRNETYDAGNRETA
jgi:hypothetical protein